MLDQYTYGEVRRISPEAPIPILNKQNESFALGGAANVAQNIVSLGARAVLCGVVGKDYKSEAVFELLKSTGISPKTILTDSSRRTTLKHRLMAGNQQLMRLDDEIVESLSTSQERQLLGLIKNCISECDVIIISDYNKGLVSKSLIKQIVALAEQNNKPVLVDPKQPNPVIYKGVDIITPNLSEGKIMTGFNNIEEIGQKIVNLTKARVALTLGEDGVCLFQKRHKPIHIPAKRVSVFDVTGAGDTYIAALALAVASELNFEAAATLGNFAARVVIQKQGTATLSKEELLSELQNVRNLDDAETVPKFQGIENSEIVRVSTNHNDSDVYRLQASGPVKEI